MSSEACSLRGNLILLFACVATAPVARADVFNITIQDTTLAGQPTVNLTRNTSLQTIGTTDEVSLVQLFPGYTNTDALNGNVNFRGLPVLLNYSQGSTALVVNFPDLGISRTFDGGSRDASNRLFIEFLKQNNDDMKRILRRLAEVSPTDPIAGNPNSLMAQFVTSDFNQGFTDAIASDKQGNDKESRFGIGVNAGSTQQSGITVQNIGIPLSYSTRYPSGNQLIVGAMLNVVDADSARSYSFAPKISFRIPFKDNWALTSSFTVGRGVSRDLGTAGEMISLSATSAYTIKLRQSDLHIGNMVGYYQTLQFGAYGYSFDPELKNTVLRNGAVWTMPLQAGSHRLSMEYFLIDTRYFGSKLFQNQYSEFGFSIGSGKQAKGTTSLMRGGLTYLGSSKSRGLTMNFGYIF